MFTIGETQVLKDEIEKLVRNRTTRPAFSKPYLSPDQASDVDEFNVDSVRPLVSVIAKISPSPDWFIGVHDLDLCDRTNGKWVETKQVRPVYPYDAGTDSGMEFTSGEDRPSNSDISRISGPPLEPWAVQPRALGVWHFVRISTTGDTTTGNFESDETFVCPSTASLSSASYAMALLISLCVSLNY